MRWVFLSLVSFNLVVMVWFWKDQPLVMTHKKPDYMLESGERLTLVSEINKVDLNYKKTRIEQANNINDLQCYNVGPFKEKMDAKFFRIRAEAIGFTSEIRLLTTGEIVENWVHIPPLPNRAKALQLLKEIQGRGIDSYLITQGELSEGISLGLFKNEVSAKNLMSEMNNMGYDVIINKVPRSDEELWLEFPQISLLTDAMRERIMDDGLEVEWVMTNCKKTR